MLQDFASSVLQVMDQPYEQTWVYFWLILFAFLLALDVQPTPKYSLLHVPGTFIHALQSNMDTKNIHIMNSCLQQSLFHSHILKYFYDVVKLIVPITLLQWCFTPVGLRKNGATIIMISFYPETDASWWLVQPLSKCWNKCEKKKWPKILIW